VTPEDIRLAALATVLLYPAKFQSRKTPAAVLADVLDVSPSAISRYLSGDQKPTTARRQVLRVLRNFWETVQYEPGLQEDMEYARMDVRRAKEKLR
jgi:hypothetical protein